MVRLEARRLVGVATLSWCCGGSHPTAFSSPERRCRSTTLRIGPQVGRTADASAQFATVFMRHLSDTIARLKRLPHGLPQTAPATSRLRAFDETRPNPGQLKAWIYSPPSAGPGAPLVVVLHVTDEWFQDAPEALLFDTKVHLVPPTQFVWSKIYVQDRYRYDGADVTHMILKRSEDIDWKQLISSMELHWEVLLVAVLNFRFIYPSERHLIPRWVMDELLERLHAQLQMPSAGKRVCRGRIFSPRDYQIDVGEWGFSEAVGNLEENYAAAQ